MAVLALPEPYQHQTDMYLNTVTGQNKGALYVN